jgi:hypothetical protein
VKTWAIGNSRQKLHAVLSMLANFLIRPEDDYELIFRKRVYKRTNEQNKRYWAILQELAEQCDVKGEKYSAETWHEYMKGRFIGYEDVPLPNGTTLHRPISTTTLDKPQFTEYMTQIEAWAAHRGILLGEEMAA